MMIEAIPVSAVPTATAASAVTAGQATPYDLREFAAALERAGGAGGHQAGAAASAPAAETAPSQGTRAVLAALDQLNGGAENIGALSRSMTAGAADLTPGEMMQMTMRCHQFLFTSELTSNVANRTSDGIQQLFRQQS